MRVFRTKINMLPSIYKYFAIALPFLTSSLSTSNTNDDFRKLKVAVLDNDVNTVHQLLLQNATDWLTENRGWELSRIAAEKGNLPMIQYIAERKLSILEKKNEENETIGHIAAEHGHPQITEYILNKTKSSYGSPLWSERRSLFDLVAEKGYLNCISGFVDPHFDDLERLAKIAAQNGHLDVVCSIALQKSGVPCYDFRDIIQGAIRNSRRIDRQTVELLGKLTDVWSTNRHYPNVVELAFRSSNHSELIEYLAEYKFTRVLEFNVYSDCCNPMEIALKRNLVNRNFLDCLERGNGTILGYLGESKLTICHLAAKYDRLDIVRFFVERDASVLEKADDWGKTVANFAAEKGYADIVRYAVRQRPLAPVLKTWHEFFGDIRWNGQPWRYANSTAFQLAVAKNLIDIDTLKYVIEEEGIDLITRVGPFDGATVAHLAAANSNMEIIQYLVEKEPSILSIPDSSGNCVLHILARKKKVNEKWLKFYVEKGAPLAAKDRNKDTVCHILANQGRADLVEYLAENDPTLVTIVDGSGDTMLHLLARRNSASVKISRLLADKGTPLLAYNKRNENIPYFAAKNGDLEMLRFIEEKEPSVFRGNTSIAVQIAEVAANRGHSNVLKFIMDKKPILLADYPSVLFKLPNASEVLDTLRYLHAACEAKISNWDRRTFENKVFSAAFEHDYPDILRFMKYDVNMVNDEGEPLIFTALRRRRPNIFYYLADDGRTNLTALDREGNNILFIAVMEHDLKKIPYILDTLKAPIDVEWRNEDGDSLLHVAVHAASTQADGAQNSPGGQSTDGGIELIKYLVEEKHARTYTKGHENMTALHCAVRRGNLFISNYLLDHGACPKVGDASGSNLACQAFRDSRNQIPSERESE